MKEVSLTQGKVALVDDEDYERVMQHKWYAHRVGRTYYAARSRYVEGIQSTQQLHCFLLGVLGVDHIDGDGLNDQRYNLRVATQLQNLQAHKRKRARASSLYRGVSWSTEHKKWTAKIGVDRVMVYLGRFEQEEVAARAYDAAAQKYYGEFASPNFSC